MARSSQTEPNDLDELLRPTITEADDALGFSYPWNPNTIVLLSFLFGSMTGAGLLAMNGSRLGMRNQLGKFLVGGLVFTVTLNVLLIFLIAPTLKAIAPSFAKMGVKLIRVGVVTISAWLASAAQRRRYRLALVTDAPLGSLWVPGTIACIVGWIVEVGIVFAIAMIVVVANG